MRTSTITSSLADKDPNLTASASISPPAALRVVAIGGGTGLSTLLRGLRRHVAVPGQTTETGIISDLAALVTVTDDGGSSGRLRKGFNMLPPGDLRNCMVALSEEEDLISQLFRHRFKSGGDIEGHNFGNLFVAALTEITGDFGQAIQLASKILATRGRIYPVTTANATLVAEMDDGSLVRGETNISASKRRIVELTLEPPDAAPLPEALEAIERADLITVGPGSLYTSLITNLLVKGIPEALTRACGVRVFICNLMTQANESLGLTASQHIERIYEHTGAPIFDYAILNSAPVSPEMLLRYAAEGAAPIIPDVDRVESLGVRCIVGNFLSEGEVLRHAGDKVAGALLELGRLSMIKNLAGA
ncbi:uridine diphosphate-N-acetylglucosamine-binding protein YvcK [Acidicapsa dinghuensis]|uniref:Putative gluconeogenesis factor n=1 Tax=Acidicapsa dinghuensis TaxID=2218256 RepID=A0ABW1EMW4_9BACT